jgi:hypothetical protein
VRKKWLLALLFRGGIRGLGCLRGLSFRHALLELVDAAGRIHKLLRTRVKRVARITDTHDYHGLGRTRLDHIAARATNFSILVFWMNINFHIKTA